MILAVIAIVVGVAALVGVALLTSSGSTEVRLGDDEFEVGEAATLAARIEADGAPLSSRTCWSAVRATST